MVRKSLWGEGKSCATMSEVSSVRFHGPLRYQKSLVGVASFGAPYCSIICSAIFRGASGQDWIRFRTIPMSTLWRAPSSVSCSPSVLCFIRSVVAEARIAIRSPVGMSLGSRS